VFSSTVRDQAPELSHSAPASSHWGRKTQEKAGETGLNDAKVRSAEVDSRRALKVLRQTDLYKEAPILQKTLLQTCIRGI
jgi:hypothetical protein